MMYRFLIPGRGRIPLPQKAGDARAIPTAGFNPPSSQHGSALFVAIFLIAVVSVLAAAVALTSVTQQTGAARAFEAEQAWYAALGRIESETPDMLASGACPGGVVTIAGFDTSFTSCDLTPGIQEGGQTYTVFSVAVTAQRGNAAAGTLVRRTARAQFTNRNPTP
ncbi:MAG: hypothetical protein WD397_16860 [Wenzhouxiangellaceae bacterium]